MRIHIFYKHEDGNKTSYTLQRQAEADPAYISFTPENGESFPFPNEPNPVALARIIEMAIEYAQMEEALQVMGIETEVEQDEAQ